MPSLCPVCNHGVETFVRPQVRKPAIQQARRPALQGKMSNKAQRKKRPNGWTGRSMEMPAKCRTAIREPGERRVVFLDKRTRNID
jgi:hypothetical protein